MIKSAEIKCFSVAANLIFYHVFTKSNKLGHLPLPSLPPTHQEVVVRALRISCALLRDSSCNDYLLEQMRPTDELDIFGAKPKTDSHFSVKSSGIFVLLESNFDKTKNNLSCIQIVYTTKRIERLFTRYY